MGAGANILQSLLSPTTTEMRENTINEYHSEEEASNQERPENYIKREPRPDSVNFTNGNAKNVTPQVGNGLLNEEIDLSRPYADGKMMDNDENNIDYDEDMTPKQDDSYDDLGYDAQIQDMSDNNVPASMDADDDNLDEASNDPNIWTLPADRNVCTLEEIRRGQVINKTAPNECPVLGCGKKINEMRAEPSPGTIASGLRTHVLFVHYANRKVNKKRKLGWSTKRRSQPSPRKQLGPMSSPSTSKQSFELDSHTANMTSGLNLIQKACASQASPGSLLNKKVKQLAAKTQALQMSSLQSLMQATGGPRISPQPKQRSLDANASQKNFNPTTSSLFSILAGLTQQQQQMNQTQSISRNVKTAQGTNTINISQCSRNPINSNSSSTNNRPANSSLLSLLNEKISGNVANSLQTQLKKTLGADSRIKIPASTPRQNVSSPANSSYYQSNTDNDVSFNNSTSILSSLCSVNGDSMPLNSFIESIAARTGSNIGSAGVAEAKKIIEKFTTSLICSSQTIADHYIAPYAGDVPQQKPEISPSDVMLAYKMMERRG